MRWDNEDEAAAAHAESEGARAQAEAEAHNAEAESDPVGCKCDEFPECTHALYWHMGFKAGLRSLVGKQPAKQV